MEGDTETEEDGKHCLGRGGHGRCNGKLLGLEFPPNVCSSLLLGEEHNGEVLYNEGGVI